MNIVRILYWCCGMWGGERIRLWSNVGLLGVIVMLEVVVKMMIYGSCFMNGCKIGLLCVVCVLSGCIGLEISGWVGVWCWRIFIINLWMVCMWSLFRFYLIVLLVWMVWNCCMYLWSCVLRIMLSINWRGWKFLVMIMIRSIVLRFFILNCRCYFVCVKSIIW